jgi:hypothetical protein
VRSAVTAQSSRHTIQLSTKFKIQTEYSQFSRKTHIEHFWSHHNEMSSQYLDIKDQFAYTSGSQSRSNSASSSNSSLRSPLSSSPGYTMEGSHQQSGATVEIMRCSRCAKTVEAISRRSNDGMTRVSSTDASASGMVRFGHNLYYCDRCARMVGYK